MENKEKILIVEDDASIARILSDHLRKEGFFVTWASTGKEGWEDFKSDQYQLVLIDLMLPEMDGFTLCKTIRLEHDTPIIIISAKTEVDSKISGLDLGADDYITKPFRLDELTARINAQLRRYRRYMNTEEQDVHEYYHGLKIDFKNEVVFLEGEPVQLTAKEIELLFVLAKNPFKTFSKSELYEHVWQQEDLVGNNTVTVHVKSLRTKLQDEAKTAKFIQTVWGVGYRFIGERKK
ncbi:response regulator transcription factor [Pallidibacillus pasinlerensis]|uniref:Response regulator transcription factor n=1 Tax=Pallidibacillus pasinlerensis TaxID=2703818 RepID=A0ABX0A0A7_9BACI|nr:response regulator transcription factor [Pallidibacillus pasinlerensis]NCU16828.1 response regulator transcription factor [Pallidibacillus pasinlerensis]